MFGDKAIRFFWIPFVLFFAFWGLKVWVFSLGTGYGTKYVEKIVYGVLLAMAAIHRFFIDFFERRNHAIHLSLTKAMPYGFSFCFSCVFNFFVVFVLMEQPLY